MKRFIREENILKDYVEGDFEERLLKAAFQNLRDHTNELRFNNFSYSIRELSRHILYRHSPDKLVNQTSWFVSEIPGSPNKTTRTQRIKFAVQGGITDAFVRDELELDLNPLCKRINRYIDQLSKYTHVEKATLGISKRKINELVNETVSAFVKLFDAIATCRAGIVRKIEDELDNSMLSLVVGETFDEVEMLSTHSSIEDCYINNVVVDQITEKEIHVSVTGHVAVRLQYGSDGDVSRGNGDVSNDAYPFTCRLVGDVNQLQDFKPEIDSMSVDTESFYQ